jgi:hypothetical protein
MDGCRCPPPRASQIGGDVQGFKPGGSTSHRIFEGI